MRAPSEDQRGRGTPDTSVYVILIPLRHQCAPGRDSMLPWLKAAVEPSSENQVDLAHLQQKPVATTSTVVVGSSTVGCNGGRQHGFILSGTKDTREKRQRADCGSAFFMAGHAT